MAHGGGNSSGSTSASSGASATSTAAAASSSTSTGKSGHGSGHGGGSSDSYDYELWWVVAGFLFVCGVVRVMTLTNAWLHRRGYLSNDPEVAEEKGEGNARPRSISLRRLHLAALNFYRIVAFRFVIDFGAGYTLNLAEVVLTIVYMFLALFFTFMAGEFVM